MVTNRFILQVFLGGTEYGHLYVHKSLSGEVEFKSIKVCKTEHEPLTS